MRTGVWSKREVENLKKWYPNHTIPEVAFMLGRSVASTRTKIGYMGLRKRNWKAWTDKETRFLLKNHGNITNVAIALRLNRCLATVNTKIHELGLHTYEEKYY